MKIIFRTVIFHIFSIILFGIIYLSISEQFLPINEEIHKKSLNNKIKYSLDFFVLSSSIQTSIGLTNLYPITTLSKLLIIFQEMIMVSTHLFTLYFFVL